METDTQGIHSGVKAIQDLEAACSRFGRAVVNQLPEVEREINEISDALDARITNLRREISELEQRISSADQDEDTSWESCRVSEAEDELGSLRRHIRKFSEIRENYTTQARKVEHLATSHIVQMREFLAGATDDLKAFITKALDGKDLGIDNIRQPAGPGAQQASASGKRTEIRNSHYTFSHVLGGGINVSVLLRNGLSVVFKPATGEYPVQHELPPGIPRGTQFRREKAASLVDEILNLGLVPPTEIIAHQGLIGSAQLYKGGFDTARQLLKAGRVTLSGVKTFAMLSNRQRQDWQLLDEITGNMDRHRGNWMLGPDSKGGFKLALIDNGLSFGEGGETRLKSKPASQEKLDATSRTKIEHLLETETQWREKLVELVGVAAVEHMIRRAQNLLSRGYYA